MGTRTFRRVIVWHRPVPIERDTNLTMLRRLELVTIDLDGRGMSEDQIMPHNPWLCRGITLRRAIAVAASSRSENPASIAMNGYAPGLVEGEP